MTRAHFDIYAPVGGHGLPDRPRPVAKVEITEATFAEFNAGIARARKAAQQLNRRREEEERQTPPAPSPS